MMVGHARERCGACGSGTDPERGAVTIIVAVMLTVFMAVTALAVDIGYVMVTRNQLQNVADASALASARKLGSIYDGTSTGTPMPYSEQLTYVADAAALISTAQQVAMENSAGGKNIYMDPSDVIIGTWDATTKTLTPTLTSPDAVQVTARRDSGANGPINTFFARIFAQDTVDVHATATAALTGAGAIAPGLVGLPLGISQVRFDRPFCGQNIILYPTQDSCAGWNTYEDSPSSDNQLRNYILPGLINGTYKIPGATAGVTEFDFVGGNLSTHTIDEFPTLFDTMKVKNDGIIDFDNDPTTWTTTVVVYADDSANCSNPHGPLVIVGFAAVTVSAIQTAPNVRTFVMTIDCGDIRQSRGGGAMYGTKGSIPGLVQ